MSPMEIAGVIAIAFSCAIVGAVLAAMLLTPDDAHPPAPSAEEATAHYASALGRKGAEAANAARRARSAAERERIAAVADELRQISAARREGAQP